MNEDTSTPVSTTPTDDSQPPPNKRPRRSRITGPARWDALGPKHYQPRPRRGPYKTKPPPPDRKPSPYGPKHKLPTPVTVAIPADSDENLERLAAAVPAGTEPKLTHSLDPSVPGDLRLVAEALQHSRKPAEPRLRLKSTKPDRRPFELRTGAMLQRKIALWHPRWGTAELRAARADMSARDFDRGFRQMPISEDDLVFKTEVIEQCKDASFVAIDHVDPDGLYGPLTRFGGVDLAIAKIEASGAFFVYTVIGIDRNGHRWVLWIERQRGLSLLDQFGCMLDIQRRFQPLRVKVENNAYQEAMVRHVEDYNRFAGGEQVVIPVERYTTSALTRQDFQLGIPSLAVEFEQRRWHFPIGDSRSRRILEPLFEELAAFGIDGWRDDCVLSLFFARECHRAETTRQSVISLEF